MTYSYYVNQTVEATVRAYFDSDLLLETPEEVRKEVNRLEENGEIDWEDLEVVSESNDPPYVERDGKVLEA